MGERRRTRRQAGSVLMLVPAAVLVLMVLGAIAVDFALAFSAQRELSSAAAAAANDAAGAAVSQGAGPAGLDQERARRIATAAVAATDLRGVHDVTHRVTVAGDQVCVELHGRVDYLFAKAVPGGPKGTTVRGRAVVTAVQGAPGARVPDSVVC